MITTRRAPFVLATAALLLAGCSSTVEGSASPASPGSGGSSSSSAPSSSSGSSGSGSGSGSDLEAGLLPESAFGAGAVLTPVSEADVAAGNASGGGLAGATITPEACAAAVQKSQPSVEDIDGFAAQTATTGTTIAVEVITQGAPGDPVADLASAVQTCPQATISSPELGSATITFAALDVPALGDGSGAITYTTVVTSPDGTQLSIPAQVGVVADGDRSVTLVSTSLGGGALDAAAFGELLRQAYEYQSDQLD